MEDGSLGRNQYFIRDWDNPPFWLMTDDELKTELFVSDLIWSIKEGLRLKNKRPLVQKMVILTSLPLGDNNWIKKNFGLLKK